MLFEDTFIYDQNHKNCLNFLRFETPNVHGFFSHRLNTVQILYLCMFVELYTLPLVRGIYTFVPKYPKIFTMYLPLHPVTHCWYHRVFTLNPGQDTNSGERFSKRKKLSQWAGKHLCVFFLNPFLYPVL